MDASEFLESKKIFEGNNLVFCLVRITCLVPADNAPVIKFGKTPIRKELQTRLAVQQNGQSDWLVYPRKLGALILDDLLQEAEENGTTELYGALLKEAQLEFRRNENER